jgi:hypothetical protein
MRRAAIFAIVGWLALAVVASARPGEPALSVSGWGGLRIGMSGTEAARRYHLTAEQADGDCRVLRFPGRTDLTIMTRAGRVASLIVFAPSRLKTDRGLGIGAREADIHRAYGPGLKVEPNAYEDPPAHYLTFWEQPGERGVMYETDRRGRVTAIHVGDETIAWTDGCG